MTQEQLQNLAQAAFFGLIQEMKDCGPTATLRIASIDENHMVVTLTAPSHNPKKHFVNASALIAVDFNNRIKFIKACEKIAKVDPQEQYTNGKTFVYQVTL